jgi:hypothetical protein
MIMPTLLSMNASGKLTWKSPQINNKSMTFPSDSCACLMVAYIYKVSK